MASFKEYIEEAATGFDVSSFYEPPPRAKFHVGDIVITRDAPGAGWGSYQPRKSDPYLNKVGTVVSYKNIPGSYSKFAIKFEDDMVVPVHSHFVFGPFKSTAIAKTYASNPKKAINNQDLTPKQGAILHKTDQIDAELEQSLQLLASNTNLGFTWLAKPYVVKNNKNYPGTSQITILAEKPFPEIISKDSYKGALAVPGKLTIYRVNHNLTKALKPVPSDSPSMLVPTEKQPDQSTASYHIEIPASAVASGWRWNIYQRENLISFLDLAITNKSLKRYNNVIIQQFAKVNNFNKRIKTSNASDEEVIEFLYNVVTNTEGKKIIMGDVSYFVTSFKDPFIFRNYYINGDFRYDDSDVTKLKKDVIDNKRTVITTPMRRITDCTFLPLKITGGLTIEDNQGRIKNLNGLSTYIGKGIQLFQCNGITNLEGMPVKVNSIRVNHCKRFTNVKGLPTDITDKHVSILHCPIQTLEDFPDIEGLNITINDCSLTTLKGLPKSVHSLTVRENNLTNLEGCPQVFTGDKKTIYNHDKTLLDIDKNPLQSLDGIATDLEPGNISASETPFNDEVLLAKELKRIWLKRNTSTDTYDTFADLFENLYIK